MARVIASVVALLAFIASVVAILEYVDVKPPPRIEPAPALRVKYFRLGGATPDFLVRGLLTDEWKKALGGPQEILQNEVLDTARETLRYFGRPLDGDVLIPSDDTKVPLSARYLNDYIKKMDWGQRWRLSSYDWQAYLGSGGNHIFFLPDFQATSTFLSSPFVPAGYSVFHFKGYPNEPRPVIWRFLRVADLETYYERMRQYLSRLSGHEREYREWHDARAQIAVNGLRWLTRRGLPPNFILVRGEPEPHGGWALHAWMRDIELEVVVIENLSKQPLSVSELVFSSWGNHQLRPQTVTDEKLAAEPSHRRRLTPSMVLAAGEKVIVPTRISFVQKPDRMSLERAVPNYPRSSTSPDMLDVPLTFEQAASGVRNVVVPKLEREILRNEIPTIVERFDFGPSWRPESIVVNGVQKQIRAADWSNMSLYIGTEKGSCPFVFTRSDGNSPWINEGHVLLGATSRDLTRTEVKALTRFDGGAVIRGLEDEVSFISSVRLIVDLESGESEVLLPQGDFAGEFVVLRYKDAVVRFDNYRADRHRNPRLEVTGYYRPLAIQNISN